MIESTEAGAPATYSPGATRPASRRPRRFHVLLRALGIAALAFASSASSLGNQFAYDDRIIVAENTRIHRLDNVGGLFADTYWPEQNGAALYRPLTLAAFAAEWAVGDGNPIVFHVVNVALYVVVALAVWWLAALLLPPAAAWVAGALFAVHPVHVEAVGNVVGQAELLAGLTLILGTALYIRDRLKGVLRPGTLAAIAGLYIVGCLTKEHGIILPALLLLAELTVTPPVAPVRRRARELWPVYGLLGAIAIAYLAARASVLGNVKGEFANIALAHVPFDERLLTMLRVAPEWGRLLLWPANLKGDYSPREIEIVSTVTPTVISGAVTLLCVLALLALTWRRRPVIAFGIGFIALALFPVSNLVVTSGVVLAERTLFTPSVGVVIVIGAVLALLMEVAARGATVDSGGRRVLSPFWRSARYAGIPLLAVVLAVGAVRSANRQRVWKDNGAFFRQLVIDAPLSYRARWANGALLFDSGYPGLGEREMRYAIALFPQDADLLEDLATRYLRAGICRPAVDLFRDALAIVPNRGTSRMGLVACLMREGRYAEASAEAREGLRYGAYHTQLARLRDVADSLAAANPAKGGT